MTELDLRLTQAGRSTQLARVASDGDMADLDAPASPSDMPPEPPELADDSSPELPGDSLPELPDDSSPELPGGLPAVDEALRAAALAEDEAARALAKAKKAKAKAKKARQRAEAAAALTSPSATNSASTDAGAPNSAPATTSSTMPASVAESTTFAAPSVVAKPTTDAATSTDAESTTAEESTTKLASAESPETRTLRSRVLSPLVLAVVLLVAAVVFAVVSWVQFDHSRGTTSSTIAQSRDAALLAAQQDIVVLNTLDYRAVSAGLRNWSAASTGSLHDSLAHITAANRSEIVASKAVTTAKVLAAAVTDLDARAGSATVIASVQVTVTPSGGKATVKRNRYSATMTRVGKVWKASSLQLVGVAS